MNLFILKIPENSPLIHQIYLNEKETLTVLGNSPRTIPENYDFQNHSHSRRETVQELLVNDNINKNPQVWHLCLKEKKLGITPKCRVCRTEQTPG